MCIPREVWQRWMRSDASARPNCIQRLVRLTATISLALSFSPSPSPSLPPFFSLPPPLKVLLARAFCASYKHIYVAPRSLCSLVLVDSCGRGYGRRTDFALYSRRLPLRYTSSHMAGRPSSCVQSHATLPIFGLKNLYIALILTGDFSDRFF